MFKRTLLLGSILSTTLLSACGGSSDSTTHASTKSVFDSFPAAGSSLPYSVLRNDIIDAKTQQTLEIRNGGYGSAMTKHPTNTNQFYAMTDRGPNAAYTGGSYGSGVKFPVPTYTPRIGLFEVGENGAITQIKEILLKRPDGRLISGLPNNSGLGGTGETPYNVDGTPVRLDQSADYDATTNPIKLDDYGLDSEGLVALKDGTFWVSDEYGPHIVHYDANGIEIGRINAFTTDARVTDTTGINLPAEFANRWANRGMEGLAITPDEKTLVGIMQSTLYNPTKAETVNFDLTRIVTINLETKEIGQYLYQQDKAKNANSEIVALSATEFLVIDRDTAFLYGGPKGSASATPDAIKHINRIDLSTATNLETVAAAGRITQDAATGLLVDGKTLEAVPADSGDANVWATLAKLGIQPVEKTLVVDMVAEKSYPHDKMEGLWVINENTLGVINDDDFATWVTAGALEQKMLDSSTIDHNHLFIINTKLTK
ncbi:MAG: esterase-like activity of phytase family protein [Thiomicrospira sp.]|jgi:hypothetical protein|nr:esterase-like activity of phytase family protein [Thiomicrospira sp.]